MNIAGTVKPVSGKVRSTASATGTAVGLRVWVGSVVVADGVTLSVFVEVADTVAGAGNVAVGLVTVEVEVGLPPAVAVGVRACP